MFISKHRIYLVLTIILLMTPIIASAKCMVVVKAGNLRSGPGTDYKTVGKVEFGEFFESGSNNITVEGDWISFDSPGQAVNESKIITAWHNKENSVYKHAKVGQTSWLVESPDKPTTYVRCKIIEYTGKVAGDLHEVLCHPEENIRLFIHKSLVLLKEHNYECNNYLEEIKKRKAINQRLSNIKKRHWSKRMEDLVIARKITLGMTKEQVIASWGKPEYINRTVGNWGVHEQWVYGSTYVYFENGILTAWQD